MRIFGIDQTGAILKGNKARSLKACELILSFNPDDQKDVRSLNSTLCASPKIQNVVFFQIPHLGDWIKSLNLIDTIGIKKGSGLISFEDDLEQIGEDTNLWNQNYIFIDCVFGLPIQLHHQNPNKTIRDWILKTKTHHLEHQSYGRTVSEDFFNQIKKFYNLGVEEFPKRAVEVQLKSNSVFKTRPFQKNIQTGTYRIWKDLSDVLDHVHIWPIDLFNQTSKKNLIFEVYPSYLYKILFNSKVRNSKPLLDFLILNGVALSKEHLIALNNPDFCDAFVSAIGGLKILQQTSIKNFKSREGFFEGNIWGSHMNSLILNSSEVS